MDPAPAHNIPPRMTWRPNPVRAALERESRARPTVGADASSNSHTARPRIRGSRD